jgi:hypothetical protein
MSIQHSVNTRLKAAKFISIVGGLLGIAGGLYERFVMNIILLTGPVGQVASPSYTALGVNLPYLAMGAGVLCFFLPIWGGLVLLLFSGIYYWLLGAYSTNAIPLICGLGGGILALASKAIGANFPR